MHKIILKNTGLLDIYTCNNDQNISLNVLAHFLTSTRSYDTSRYLEWLRKPYHEEDDHVGHNVDSLRFSNNKIIVEFEFNETPEDPNTVFVATIPEMIEILESWKKILELKPKPDEIIITQDDSGKVSLETKFYPNK